jgi:quercetin dioxygenase-like cupin family protein
MKLVLATLVLWSTMILPLEAQNPPATKDPYTAFVPWMETHLLFVTDVSVPGGPTFQVKVYDWVIGARREVPNFPLEGAATFQLNAGQLETTMNGVTVQRLPGEYWVVPPGTKLGIRVKTEANRGDNMVSMHGVVLVRK